MDIGGFPLDDVGVAIFSFLRLGGELFIAVSADVLFLGLCRQGSEPDGCQKEKRNSPRAFIHISIFCFKPIECNQQFGKN